MSTIGVTGHQTIGRSTERAVTAMLKRHLSEYESVIGVSSLAVGADQLFGECVLACGGVLVAIVPSRNYERTFNSEAGLTRYRELLAKAVDTVFLDFSEPGEEAYMAAGREIVDRCDVLFAVWDGKPAGGLGGTADVVAYAKTRGREIKVLWPAWGQRA